MHISIVIPTRNRPESLRQCLDAITRSAETTPLSWEIHVVDDGSEPEKLARNENLCRRTGITCHLQQRNRGMAVTRNLGLNACTGNWVAFIDDDIQIDDNWFTRIAYTIKNADESVIGIEGFVRGGGNGVWDREVECLEGGQYLTCHIVYRTSTLRAAGGFDEHFEHEGPYHEDHELAARMLQYGTIDFDRNLKATHLPRRINPVRYISESVKRMSQLLNAEIYFFLKQRDRYHLFRFAGSFMGTYRAIAVRHVFSTLHRRSLSILLCHPIQTFSLVIATCVEQVTAWRLFPHLLRRFLNETAQLLSPAVNLPRTLAHWHIHPDNSIDIFQLARTPSRLLRFAINRQPVYDTLNTTDNIRRIADPVPVTRLFLRVDDVFFGEDILFKTFISAMRRLRIPFLAAVTADDINRPDASKKLMEIILCGGAIGIHGFSHQGRFGPFDSEILQLNLPVLDAKLLSVRQKLSALKINPIAFVAPFNAINAMQIIHISSVLLVICGGPETARFTERLTGPLVLETGAVYFPSFFPFYGDSSSIRANLRLFHGRLCGDICLTVHMPRECTDACASLYRLADSARELLQGWPILPFAKERRL